jgi:hypothetical protein
MRPSPPIRNRSDTCHSGLRSHGSTPARAGPQNWPAIVPQILASNARSTSTYQHASQSFEPKPPYRQPRISSTNTHVGANSP